MNCRVKLQQLKHKQQRTQCALNSVSSNNVNESRVESKLNQCQLRRRNFLLSSGFVLQTLNAFSSQAKPDEILGGPPTITTPSGLKIQNLRSGKGTAAQVGDSVSVHWSGYTIGYQGKRIDNTSVRDEPFRFTIGAQDTIPAFEEALVGMKPGDIRRVEVPGEHPELSYPISRSERYLDGGGYKYRFGPQPKDFDGQRSLDFILDNSTLRDFNRTLLFDIKLLNVYKN